MAKIKTNIGLSKFLRSPAALVVLALAAAAGFLIYQSRASGVEVPFASWHPNPADCRAGNTCHDAGVMIVDTTSPTGNAWQCGALGQSGKKCWYGPNTTFDFTHLNDLDTGKIKTDNEQFKYIFRSVINSALSAKFQIDLVARQGGKEVLITSTECTSGGASGYVTGFATQTYKNYDIHLNLADSPLVYDNRMAGEGPADEPVIDGTRVYRNPDYELCDRNGITVARYIEAQTKNFEHRITANTGEIRIAKTEWIRQNTPITPARY